MKYKAKYIFGKEIEVEANSIEEAKEIAIQLFVKIDFYQYDVNIEDIADDIDRNNIIITPLIK